MKNSNTALRLKQLMKERNLKQIDIVRLAEPYCKENNTRLGRNDISQYVAGKSEPGQHKLYILGKALNVVFTAPSIFFLSCVIVYIVIS